MTELIEKVKEAKKLLNDSQKELLSWCQNQDNGTLDQRFNIWCKYVDKEKRSYIGCSGSKVLESLIDMWTSINDIERHQTVSWDWVLESLCDWYGSDKKRNSILDVLNKHKQLIRDKRIDTVLNSTEDKIENSQNWLGRSIFTSDEFENFLKEEIMVANFGSFEFNW